MNRRPLYAKIAIARKQLPGMDDDNFYRGWLSDKFWGKRSASDLTDKELARLVDLLGRMGARYTSKGDGKRQKRPYVRADFIEVPEDDPNAPTKRMICAIWRKLGYAMTGLETRVERQTSVVSILALNNEKELSAILTDLQKRERAFEKKRRAGGEQTA